MKTKKFRKIISKCLVACMVVTIMVTGDFGTLISRAGQREDVVALARSQVGYHEKTSNANLDDYYANSGSGNYTKYARDLGVGNGQPWCAYFVWWVLQSSGVDPTTYPRTGWVPTMVQWFKNAGLYRSSGGSYVPNPGDIVFFGSGYGHVGMVEYVWEGYVHCIEGNSNDCVRQTCYNLYTSTYMRGFGCVNYKPSDTTKPTITDVKVIEQTASSYTVQCTVTDDVAVAKVQFPTWTEEGGQDDITWDTVSESANGVFTYTINVADHGNTEGIYNTHIYAHDTSGNISDCQIVQVTMDRTAPSFSVVEIRELTSEGFRLQFEADDNLTGVQHVGCLAYISGNESVIPENWYEDPGNFATNIGDKKWEYNVKIADHDNARGSYDVKLLAYDKCNNVCEYIIKDIVVPNPENIVTGSVAGDIAANEPLVYEEKQLNSGNHLPDVNEIVSDNTTVEVPEDTTVEVPENTTAEVPEDTTAEVPEDTTAGVPEDTTAEVPEDTTAVVPEDTTVEVPEDTTVEVPEDTTADISDNNPTNVTIDSTLDVENNYTTIVNNYISNNTYIQNEIVYTAEDIPLLDNVPVADTYVAPQTVHIATNQNETIEQLQNTNPKKAVSEALTQYVSNCSKSVQDPHIDIRENTNEDMEGYEPTDEINMLTQLQTETGEKPSISYTTMIDGRRVTFKITLK